MEDPDSDFVRAELRIDDGSWKSVEVPAGERFSTTFAVDDLEPGEHTVTMRAYDGEHLSSEQTVTVEVEEEGLLPTPGPGAVLALALLLLAALGRAGHRKR